MSKPPPSTVEAMDYDDFEEARIKHLEMIQSVIARLGNDAFVVKGWAVTVVGALFGFAVNGDEWRLAVVATFPASAFWLLDAHFLRSERLFRKLFGCVRERRSDIAAYFMDATSASFVRSLSASERHVASWPRTVVRPTLLVFYGSMIVLAVVLSVVLSRT